MLEAPKNMSRRAISVLPWLLLSLIAVLGGAAIFFLFANQAGAGRGSVGALYGDLFHSIGAFVGASVGAVIAVRRPRNPIGWLMLGIGTFQVLGDVSGSFAVYALITQPGVLPGGLWVAWIAQWIWIGQFTGLFFILLVYPTGHLLSRPWRYVAYVGIVIIAVFALLNALSKELAIGNRPSLPTFANPLGVGDLEGLLPPVIFPIILASLIGILLPALASLVIRFRRARGDERQQLKWFTYAASIAVSTIPLSIVFGDWAETFSNIVFLALPLAIGVAILKYRLYDIDLLVNRTLVYLPLTGVLAGIFAATITISQKLFLAITGQTSEAATVVTTLVVVAAFTPIKDRLQTVVDKRFKEAPDPAKKLKVLEDQIRSRMFTLEPKQAVRRLLEQAVWAFEAKGGAADFYPPASKPKFTFGEWTGDAKLSAVLESNGTRFGSISLGVRRNGTDYSATDRQVLCHISSIVASAIEQDDNVDGCGPGSERL